MTTVETDIPRIRHIRTAQPLKETYTFSPLTESAVLHITTADELRPHLYSLVDNRFPPEEAKLGKRAFEIVVGQFDGEYRRNGSEAVTHPGVVAYWDLRNNRNVSLVRFGTNLFHDNEEDLGLNRNDNVDLLKMADFPDLEAKLIAFGTFALSRIENGRKLPKPEYTTKMKIIHDFAPSLEIPEIKAGDTWHNVMSDYTQIATDPTSIDLSRVHTYLRTKADDVLAFAEKYAPYATNTRNLRHAIILCDVELASVYSSPQRQSPTAHARV